MSKLLMIQSELKATKDLRNNFGNYNYRSCETILEAVKPLLLKYNCELTLSDEIVMVGTRIYVRASATFLDIENKEKTRIEAYAREEEVKKGMDGSQITGAASSYARKYALNGLFLIDDNKDSDSTNTHGKDESAYPKPNYGTLKEPKPAKMADMAPKSDVPVGVDGEINIVAATKDTKNGLFYIKTDKGEVYKTDKEVVALLAKGRKDKGPTKIRMTIDADMEKVLLDVIV